MKNDDKHYKRVEAMLYNYNQTKVEIKNLKLEIETLENDYRGAGSITYEEKTGPTNKFNSVVENEIVSREHKIIKLKNTKRLKEIEVEKIDNALTALSDRDKSIVVNRYIDKMQIKRIAIKLNLDQTYLSAIKTDIINRLIGLLIQ